MNNFLFNTGVKIKDNPNIKGGIDSGNGTIVIPFQADVPLGSKLAFISDYPNIDKDGSLLRCEIKSEGLKGRFAYFYPNKKQLL
jgi:hypothetical protein